MKSTGITVGIHEAIVGFSRTDRPLDEILKYAFLLGLIPPVSTFFGTWFFGWPLGVVEPVYLTVEEALAIALFYAIILLIGFFTTVLVIKWMAGVYAPDAAWRDCFMVVLLAGAPIMMGGVAHLYPSILFHIIVLSPVFAFSCYLFFVAIPILLKTDKDRGVFMGCAVLGYLVTAFLSILGLSAILWVHGIGPNLGI